MKKVLTVVITILCIALLTGGYYLVSKNSPGASGEIELTEVQKVITKDLENQYPATPREVIKMYNQIITCFYNEKYSEDELYGLGDQARLLFDEKLLENNPREQYFKDLKADIEDYKNRQRMIVSANVCGTNDVDYKTIDGEECAYVQTSYFIKEKKSFERTYQMYVLRKDADDRWKILVFYKVDGDSTNGS